MSKTIEITPEMVAASFALLNTLLSWGIQHYQDTGEVPTVEGILAKNLALQNKIDAE